MRNIKQVSISIILICSILFVNGMYGFADKMSIIPKISFNAAKVEPEQDLKLTFSLNGVSIGDKTNSVTFELEYDSRAFELKTGNLEKDFIDGNIKFNSKSEVKNAINNVITAMYLDLNKDTTLENDQIVFSIDLKVKKDTQNGRKTFRLKPVKMLDSDFMVYNINNKMEYSNSIEVVGKVVTIPTTPPRETEGTSTGSSSGSFVPTTTATPMPADIKLENGNAIIKITPVLGTNGEATSVLNSNQITQAFQMATAALDGTKTVVFNIEPLAGTKTYVQQLPSQSLTQTVDKKLEIGTSVARVILRGNMLSNVSNIDSSNTASIAIATVDPLTLKTEDKIIIGEGKPIIDLSLKVDGNNVVWNNPNAPVTISIPYVATPEELAMPENIRVYYIDGSGKLNLVASSRYNKELKIITFETTHFSLYTVGFDASVKGIAKTNKQDDSKSTNQKATEEKPTTKYPATGGFKDLMGHWAEPMVMDLYSQGIVSGYKDDTIKPDNEISRAEAAVILAKALKLEPANDTKTDFVDDGNLPQWARGFIKAASQEGIIHGYPDKTFKADNTLTRHELLVMVVNAFKFNANKKELNFNDKENLALWAKDSVEKAIALQLINGYPDNTFRGENKITRAETFAVLSKALKAKK